MVDRKPAPGGVRDSSGKHILVLPDDTVLTAGYRMRYLATGGMSVVYLAYKGQERLVAKEVPDSQPRWIAALAQEKALLDRLSHPGIVKTHGFFDEGGFHYLVLDYVEGKSLDSLTSGAFPEERLVLDWALQLCDIFEYLHNQVPPVIYRDLKPRNVLVDRQGKLHLVDFGIARSFKEGKSLDTFAVGSKSTASPEHYSGQTDARSDIYTLGATLHLLLTRGAGSGPTPFDRPRLRAINPQASAGLDRVLDRCLQVSPTRRFQDVAGLRAALVSCQEPACDSQDEDSTDFLGAQPEPLRLERLQPISQVLPAAAPEALGEEHDLTTRGLRGWERLVPGGTQAEQAPAPQPLPRPVSDKPRVLVQAVGRPEPSAPGLGQPSRTLTLLAGVCIFALAFWLGSRLRAPAPSLAKGGGAAPSPPPSASPAGAVPDPTCLIQPRIGMGEVRLAMPLEELRSRWRVVQNPGDVQAAMFELPDLGLNVKCPQDRIVGVQLVGEGGSNRHWMTAEGIQLGTSRAQVDQVKPGPRSITQESSPRYGQVVRYHYSGITLTFCQDKLVTIWVSP